MPACWSRITPLTILALPVAAMFGLLVVLRRWLYRGGLLHPRRLPVPVLVIGNLTVGGTGKTPLVLWAVRMLQAAGLRPGIILRGYRGSSQSVRRVHASDDPGVAGDEAVLLAQRAGCPVWAGRDRVGSGEALLAAHPECNVLISDDGLQHYRLARDVEIAVEDERGHGNGFMLPAGPLREPASRAVDATVVNGAGPAKGRGPVFRMRLNPLGFETLEGEAVQAGVFAGKRLHAIAGIGNPQRFFDTLGAIGLHFDAHPFPDHHAYSEDDLAFGEGCAILMTEKDAVKCRAIAGGNAYVLRVAAEPDPAFAKFLLEAIHGRQTS